MINCYFMINTINCLLFLSIEWKSIKIVPWRFSRLVKKSSLCHEDFPQRWIIFHGDWVDTGSYPRDLCSSSPRWHWLDVSKYKVVLRGDSKPGPLDKYLYQLSHREKLIIAGENIQIHLVTKYELKIRNVLKKIVIFQFLQIFYCWQWNKKCKNYYVKR